MRIHPDIAALRRDNTAQRRHRAAMEAAAKAWRGSADVAPVANAFESFAGGTPLSDLPALASLVSDHAKASAFVDSLVANFTAALHENPLAEVPFRHRSSNAFTRLQVMESNGTMLSLCSYEPVAKPGDAASVQFFDCEMHEIVVAGEASGIWHERKGETIQSTARQFVPGDTIQLRPRRDMRQIVKTTKTLLVIQLTRVPPRGMPTLEYSLPDGKLIRHISGDRRASEQVVALGVLGALGQARAVEPITAFALKREADSEARWEAVRQCLAMDTQVGMMLLRELGQRSDDPLARPAIDLADRLCRQHPQLREMENA